MTPSALVLGHRGMLGHVVCRYLVEQGRRVEVLDERYAAGRELEFVSAAVACRTDAVVNCIGLATGSPAELVRVNGSLPQLLAARLGGRLLVQPSTDGVFSGRQGPYSPSARPDAEDAYGLSKRLGECCATLGTAVVLRSSLVGPEHGTARSLLGWLRDQAGTVRGFTDQLWNGVTTLCWAKVCARALDGALAPGVHQLGTEAAVTKCELLERLCETFELCVRVEPHASGRPIDRRLVPTERCPPLVEQLLEARRWYAAGTHLR